VLESQGIMMQLPETVRDFSSLQII